MENVTNTEAAENFAATRAELLRLIAQPEKHLPVSEYRAHLDAAQKAHDAAYNVLYPDLAHG